MRPQPRSRIASMLTEAYYRLGVNDVRELEKRTNEALEYLYADREHYIEVADADTREQYITRKNGVICNLIPLAREIIRTRERDHVLERTVIFSLMLSDAGNCYVYSYSDAKQYADPSKNSYSYLTYRYAEREDIRKSLVICPPREIRPAATALDREAYGMIFAAFARLDQSEDINNIPHKTERVMQACTYTLPQELSIGRKSYSGKIVPLAWEQSAWEQMCKDHRYSCRKELCLLITSEKPYYVLRTRHTYSYFRKTIYDDAPGACSYEPTEEKQETTYAFIALSDIPQKMRPHYHY